MNKLEKMREEVKKIDSDIIELISKRLKITARIGEKKKESGIPLRNWEVEKKVFDNAEKNALEHGLPPNLVKDILRSMIRESRIRQEKLHYSAYSGNREKILIVGGLGEMGKWFSDFFENQGHRVMIHDIKGPSPRFESFESLDRGLKKATCALISTSLKNVPEVIDRISKTDFDGIVFDIASLKNFLKEPVKRAIKNGIKITSMHPMFGPATRTLSDKVLCICDCGNNEANKKVNEFFKETAISTVKLSFSQHDRVISYVLGLSHIINIIWMKLLGESDFKYETLAKIGSTTFNSQMKTSSSVISEDPSLYYEIQRYNPFKEKLFADLKNNTKEIINLIEKDRKKEFTEMMTQSKKWLNKDDLY